MDWNQQQQLHLHHNHPEDDVNGGGAADNNGIFVKVMTDEQMEILRKQIAAYATICEQLVDLHKKSISPHHDLAGIRLGNLYCDPLVTSGGHKISGRQRWTPTPVQLQILEQIFEQGNGTPSKQKIKEITSDLSQHGQISETNVYNWFQNRRARSKRKQQVSSAPNNAAESEVETEVESPNEKKTKSEDFQSQMNSIPRAEDLCFQTPEVSSGLQPAQPRSDKPECGSSQMSFYGNMSSNPRLDQILGKMEAQGVYNPYHHLDDYK
jgi:hypothetical protein